METTGRLAGEGLPIALIGAGLIGAGWAVVFARAGHSVRLFDANQRAAAQAIDALRPSLQVLAELGEIPSVAALLDRITIAPTLREAVKGAHWVQESIVEDAHAKTAVFREIDECACASAIVASSSSALPPSSFLEHIPGRERCLVAHPFNPPYLLPLVELVCSRWTSMETLGDARRFLLRVGQQPITVGNEIHGFIGNRLQAAVVNEAMYLVAQGAVSPNDLDTCMRWALGLRWALMGPFETMDLNASGGVLEYATKFGRSYEAMGHHLHVADPWRANAVDAISSWRRSVLPHGELPTRMAWRDRMLLLLKHLLTEDATSRGRTSPSS